MRILIITAIILAILVPNSLILAQIEPERPNLFPDEEEVPKTQKGAKNSLKMDIDTVLDPETFFDRLFGFFESQPVIQDASDTITQEGAFDEVNEAIGEKIGVNPVDILKAFVRAIIWVLESGVAFFGNLVN
jgi:hypothetical protein